MTRFKLHLQQAVAKIPAKFYALCICTLALCCSLLALYTTINVVLVTDSAGEKRMLLTASEDPSQLMQLSGLTAGEHDDVLYTSYNGNLASLTIQRAFPVTITADGTSHTAHLTEGTVEEALGQVGLALGEHDYTVPTLSTEVAEGENITVHRVEYIDTVTEETILPQTIYRETSLLCRTKRATYTLQEGSAGTNEIVTRQRVVDGEVESAEVVSVTETVPVRDTVIMSYGAGAPVSDVPAPAGITVNGGVPSSYRTVYTGRATGYSASRGRGASGLGLYEGTVAVNPNVIPYGSLLYIVSTDGQFVYGFAIATDTGASLNEGSALVDLFYDTYMESRINGVRTVNVYVL